MSRGLRDDGDRHPRPRRVNDRRKGSCGKPMDIYEIKLFDDNDKEVAPGEIGEIVFRPRAPHVMMSEYYNMPEKTLEAFRNLWFHTGDLARKDEDGYFYFVDRKKDALRRRGRTSHPSRWSGRSIPTRQSWNRRPWRSNPSWPKTR